MALERDHVGYVLRKTQEIKKPGFRIPGVARAVLVPFPFLSASLIVEIVDDMWKAGHLLRSVEALGFHVSHNR